MWNPADDFEPVKIKDEFLNGLARLETAGGKKTIKGPNGEDSNNLFNIKDNTGQGYRARDKAEGSNDAYRVYASTDHSKNDLTSLLTRRYPDAVSAQTPEEFASALKRGGYATDPNYVQKLTATIKSGAAKMWNPEDDGFKRADDVAEEWDPTAFKRADEPKKEEPGWFQPGSKSATVVNNLSQGATFGFGDEIAAGLRSLANGSTYKDELKDLRDRAKVNNEANPATAVASNVIGSIPSYAATGAGKLAAQMAKTALVSGVQSAGNSDGNLADRTQSAVLGAATGAAVPAILKGAGVVGGKIADKITRTNPDGSVALKLGSTTGVKDLISRIIPEEGTWKDRAAGAAVGGYYGGLEGAAVGGLTGVSRFLAKSPTANVVKTIAEETTAVPKSLALKLPTSSIASPAQEAIKSQHWSNQLNGLTASIAGGVSGRTEALGAPSREKSRIDALKQMSNPTAQGIITKANEDIDQQVANGTPEYAAQFKQWQNPAYRIASQVEQDGSIDPDDEDREDEE